MRIQIRGKLWKIIDKVLSPTVGTRPNGEAYTQKRYGLCNWTTRTIYIHPKQTDRQRLGTLVHEVLHGGLPDLDETVIIEVEKALQSALWHDGYRRQSPLVENLQMP